MDLASPSRRSRFPFAFGFDSTVTPFPALAPARSEKPDLGRLPVGTLLDCYV